MNTLRYEYVPAALLIPLKGYPNKGGGAFGSYSSVLSRGLGQLDPDLLLLTWVCFNPGGGRLHIKFARMRVLRIEKYTHFEGLLKN